jgi:hypothetical protein
LPETSNNYHLVETTWDRLLSAAPDRRWCYWILRVSADNP